jgi:carbon-monoxide dehydrogenase medium subunit
VHIALGPSGPTPMRATAAEEILLNEMYSEEIIQRAYQAMLNQLSFRSSPLRASADYRRHLSIVLFRSAVKIAYERCTN